VLGAEDGSPVSIVRTRLGSARGGGLGPAEEVVRGPGRAGGALAAFAGGTPTVVSEEVRDRLDAFFRRGAPVRLSAQQLLINQRIAQAAVRRANAIESTLDAGLGAEFIRNGSIGAAAFGPSVQTSADPSAACVPAGPPAALPTTPAHPAAGRVTLSARQLLINQRIAQTAVRRANGLEARLDAGLTGGDVRDGAISAAKLAPGLHVSPAGAASPEAPTVTRLAPPARRAARVALSAEQLVIGQRIAQAAVERLNALADRLAAGLTGTDFKPASLTADDPAPSP